MSFTPFELSIREIFGEQRRYFIPNFQREFSWTKDNFDDFFIDLIESSEIKINESENTIDSDSSKYFFGMILLLGDKTSPKVDKPYEVIDGQQRLTTMTLFFAAILESIQIVDPKYEVDFYDRLIFDHTSGGERIQKPRLVNEALCPIFPIEILNLNNKKTKGAKVKAQTSEQCWLLESYDYIKNLLTKDNLIASLNSKSNIGMTKEKYVDCLEKLGVHLSNSTMICIYHNDRDEAHKLFRNLNYRGKILTPSDLIKNEIFSIIEDESQLASNSWKIINQNIYDSGYDLNQFVYHYMCGRYSGVTKNNLFEIFLKFVAADESSYIEYIDSLKTASLYYKILTKPNDNDKIFEIDNYFKKDDNLMVKRYLEFFNKIEISQLRILLITLFECRELNIIDNTMFKTYIRLIARHQAVQVLAKASANKLTGLYSKTSKNLLKLKNIEEKEDLKVKANKVLLTFGDSLKEKLPNLALIESAILSYSGAPIKDMTKNEKKDHALIRFILETISEKNQDKASNRANSGLSFIFNSTIEHIIDKKSKEKILYNLGNLLLLERDIHKNVKSKEKEKMYEESRITFTNNFFKNNANFSEKEIEKRSKELLKMFYEIVNNSNKN